MMQETFGPYQLIERLAVGGMAEIFKARTFGHAGFEKVLVIKRLHPRYTQHPEFVEMLMKIIGVLDRNHRILNCRKFWNC